MIESYGDFIFIKCCGNEVFSSFVSCLINKHQIKNIVAENVINDETCKIAFYKVQIYLLDGEISYICFKNKKDMLEFMELINKILNNKI